MIPNTIKLQDTINTYIADVERMAKVESLAELSQLEKRANAELQLMLVQVAKAGDDMWSISRTRRALLANARMQVPALTAIEQLETATYDEPVPEEKKPVEEKKSAKKAKRNKKK